jgi:hypothetical protein
VTRIRERDERCCITGQLVVGEDYTGFEAAHIFPLSETDIVGFVQLCVHAQSLLTLTQLPEWNHLNYERFIEDDQIITGYEMNKASCVRRPNIVCLMTILLQSTLM